MFKEWKLETDVLPNIEYQKKKKYRLLKRKKNWILELNNIWNKIKKKSLEGFNSRFELVEERVTK